MSLAIRVKDNGSDPAEIQAHTREVIRSLASALRPQMSFREAMSSQKGWDTEGIAGPGGVGTRLSYIEGQTTYAVTLRAHWLDEEIGEQEWDVLCEVDGPLTSDAATRRGSLLVIAGLHGAVLIPAGFYMALEPFIATTATILAVMLAVPAGVFTGAGLGRLIPPPPTPPDPRAERQAWTEEVVAALEGLSGVRLIEPNAKLGEAEEAGA